MRVLLVSPVYISDSLQPNLGLGYLAAAAGRRHEVRIVDKFTGEVRPDLFAVELRRYQPDVVGVQALYLEIDVVGDLLTVAKRWRRRCTTVIGGPAPTAQAGELFLRFGDNLDYAFAGEAEVGFPALLDILASGGPKDADLRAVPGLVRRKGSRVLANPQAVTDVASIPMPAWSLLDPLAYPPAPHGAFYRLRPVAPVITSRGCPHRCGFCAASQVASRRVRYRPLDHVLDEIEYLLGERGVREVHLVDDNFTFSREYVEAFCEGIERRRLRFPWACPNGVRLQTLSEDLLARMKAAGCYSLSMGIESGVQETLDHLRKDQTVEEARRAVGLVHESGIHAVGFFMIGIPGETRRQMEETIEFSLSLPLRRANFMFFVPFPGTPLYPEAQSACRLPRVRSFAEVSYVPDGMTAAEIKALQRVAFMRFYLRPRQFSWLLSDIRGPRHMKWVGKRMARWLVPGLESV
ncbi:MAG: B12-binding domain-containing radical SAM protein [Deltaproteobacteria bacterium]|nr:B12-binding domain-containing radical SAM protein [Deltaproteobacteria bacterium]